MVVNWLSEHLPPASRLEPTAQAAPCCSSNAQYSPRDFPKAPLGINCFQEHRIQQTPRDTTGLRRKQIQSSLLLSLTPLAARHSAELDPTPRAVQNEGCCLLTLTLSDLGQCSCSSGCCPWRWKWTDLPTATPTRSLI